MVSGRSGQTGLPVRSPVMVALRGERGDVIVHLQTRKETVAQEKIPSQCHAKTKNVQVELLLLAKN